MKKVKKAVIPAAGLGTRMLPATKTVPKEMLPIAGLPSIHYIVKEAVDSGIEDILIITNRSKDVIEDYFDYLPELELALHKSGKDDDARLIREIADMANILFVRQKETKGLGHAISRAKQFVSDDPFAVLLGDDIMMSDTPVTAQLISVYEKYACSVVGVNKVLSSEIGKYCSLDVDIKDNNIYTVKNLIEKPKPNEIMSNLAILGRYVLTPDIFDILENTSAGYGGEIQLTDALLGLCPNLLALDFEGRRFDTGSHIGYLETILEFSLKNNETSAWLMEYMKNKVK